ncbi:MAG: preprotein translocase subunit SecE [Magnetococcales bacterium]|nr:preprotein translocase subunit SecE [Magnetococcales bacterium]MBF0419189.1 preprotein translocase subunit SecE [Magnetococcales bacterium]MBF0435012.1 preprotein translocase subunit SecE [Magnetococcales bacterium]
MGRVTQFRDYLLEVRAEVRKVIWPTRKDTTQTTIVVFSMVIVVSIFLWMVDAILALAIQTVIG